MLDVLIGTLAAFLITYVAIPIVINVAKKKKLYDEPDKTRKLHKRPIPSLGGIGIFLGCISCLLIWIEFDADPEFQFYILSFLLIFFIGIQDDLLNISPIKKLLAQIVVAAILIFKTKLLINFDGLTSYNSINHIVSYIFTLVAIIAIINSFNLIDGVDGLAGSLGIITSSVFGILFLVNNNYAYALLGLTFAASLLGFLVYNFPPAKIFMGDTGSLLTGVVSSILLIKFLQPGWRGSSLENSNAPAIAFSVVLLPILDTIRVFAVRLMKGDSPFKADRNHFHHLLQQKGFSSKGVTLTCATSTILLVVSALLVKHLHSFYMMVVLTSVFFAAVFLIANTNKISKFFARASERISNSKVKKDNGIVIFDKRVVMGELLEEEVA